MLAELAVGTARKKKAELIEALRGRVTEHQRVLLRLHLELIEALEDALRKVDATRPPGEDPGGDPTTRASGRRAPQTCRGAGTPVRGGP
jgi:hypothetical protein